MVNFNKVLIVGLLICLLVVLMYFDVKTQTLEDILQENVILVEKLNKEKRSLQDSEIALKYEQNDIKQNNNDMKTTIKTLKSDIEEKKKLNEELKEKLEREKKKNKVSRGSTIKVKDNNSVYRDFTATAYCGCSKCNGKWTGMPTASGTGYKAGRTIAVDPKVIPFGSKVEVEGMGTYVAEDSGSAIKGNIIDIYFGSHAEALKFGRKKIKLRVL